MPNVKVVRAKFLPDVGQKWQKADYSTLVLTHPSTDLHPMQSETLHNIIQKDSPMMLFFTTASSEGIKLYFSERKKSD